MSVHICTGGPKLYFRGIDYCYTCRKRSRWAGFFQAWYGLTTTCLRCGRVDADGFPIQEGSVTKPVKKAIDDAREMWSHSYPWRSRESGRLVAELYGD